MEPQDLTLLAVALIAWQGSRHYRKLREILIKLNRKDWAAVEYLIGQEATALKWGAISLTIFTAAFMAGRAWL